MPETRYHIHNLTRSKETRVQRALNARHSKTVLYLGGSTVRVLRGRPVAVAESTIRRLHAELVQKETLGLLKVTTPRGDRIDLATLKPTVAAPVPPPAPKPPLDSIENDANAGIGLKTPKLVGNADVSEQLEPPKVGRRAIPEGTIPEGKDPAESAPRAPEPPPDPEPETKAEEPAKAWEPPPEVEEAITAPTTSNEDSAPRDPDHSSSVRKGSRKKTGRRK
jgi:hypothetical protein